MTDDMSSVLPEAMSLPLILSFVISLLLFLFVVLINNIRRRLHVMERQLVDIGADLRTVSLRLAIDDLDEPDEDAANSSPDASEIRPSVTPVAPSVTTKSAPPLASASDASSRRARYIQNDQKSVTVPLSEGYQDYADYPPNLSSADLLKQTHFEPPADAARVEAAPDASPHPPLTPEEEGDIWRLRATRRTPISRAEPDQRRSSPDPQNVRREPTLRWPPKSPSM